MLRGQQNDQGKANPHAQYAHVLIVAKGAKALKSTLPGKACHASGVAKKRTFGSLTEFQEFLRESGREGGKIGGKIAAKRMTKTQRVARAKKAAAASAKVRSKKAGERRKAEKAARR